MKIARVSETHASVLAAIHARAFDKSWSESEFQRLLANPGAFAFVASSEEAPHGFVLGWAIAGEAEILTIGVTPKARRNGAGRALVAAACEAARAAGAARMILEVAADNHTARALYGSAGFSQIGVRKGYYADGAVDALVLALSLA
ncbi:MAG: ribosomal protein S18-alanine N-acetyltransferase [Caulobacterales bacterium]